MRLRRLIRLYQSDPASRWHGLRYSVQKNQRNLLRQIDRRFGKTRLKKITARRLLGWHAVWVDGTKYSAGAAFIKKLRAVLGFGMTVLEDKQCQRIRAVMSAMRFQRGRPRTQRVTVEHAIAIRQVARKGGHYSMALAQALQFELMLRQKDVIGEWLPKKLPEGGPSDVIVDKRKWVFGLRWEEIDEQLVLRHRTSKTGKAVVFDLKLAPMVMAELKRYRGKLPKNGPVIVNEQTGLPYSAYDYRRRWRAIARGAGVPDNVFNMDSRAGAITEAFDAGADHDFIRASATHSDLQITQGYNRGDELKRTSAVAISRVGSRRLAA